jgi:predicted transcriptional regulator
MDKIKRYQLLNLSNDLREMINNYMVEKNMSIHAFAVETGVHPNQMYLFLSGQRGLNLTTVEKIAEIISKN